MMVGDPAAWLEPPDAEPAVGTVTVVAALVGGALPSPDTDAGDACKPMEASAPENNMKIDTTMANPAAGRPDALTRAPSPFINHLANGSPERALAADEGDPPRRTVVR